MASNAGWQPARWSRGRCCSGRGRGRRSRGIMLAKGTENKVARRKDGATMMVRLSSKARRSPSPGCNGPDGKHFCLSFDHSSYSYCWQF